MKPSWTTLLTIFPALPALLALGCGGLPPSEAALAHNAAGADLLASGDLDAAEARFRLALEYRPAFAEALANLGLVAVERGDLVEARMHVEAAVEVDEDFALGWSGVGVVRERRGDPEGAEDAYLEALAIDPGLATPRRNLGVLLARRGRFPEARAHLLRLVAVDPEDMDAGAYLAWCDLRLGRPRAALDRANDILVERHGHGRALLVRGSARARLGEMQAAMADLRRAARQRDIRIHALARLLLVMQITGDADGARRLAATLRRDARDHPAAAFALAREPQESD